CVADLVTADGGANGAGGISGLERRDGRGALAVGRSSTAGVVLVRRTVPGVEGERVRGRRVDRDWGGRHRSPEAILDCDGQGRARHLEIPNQITVADVILRSQEVLLDINGAQR